MARVTIAEGFRQFGPTHLGILVLFVAGLVVAVDAGRRVRGAERRLTSHTATAGRVAPGAVSIEDRTCKALAVALLVVVVPLHVYELLPAGWDLQSSIPIQLCDLAWLLTAIALWTRVWWAVAFTYYVGLSIVVQGVLTPSLGQNFPDVRFIGFWWMHLLVVWSAVFLTWGLGLHPTWRSYWFTVTTTAGWAIVTSVIDALTGTNYGYLAHKPGGTSLLSPLGPWPVYIVAEIVIVFFGWLTVMTLPWIAVDRRPRSAGARSGG